MKVQVWSPSSWLTAPFDNHTFKVCKTGDGDVQGTLEVKVDGVNVEVKEGDALAQSQLKNSASRYFKEKRKLLCLHLGVTPTDPTKIAIRVHGFFSCTSGPEQEQFRTLLLSFSLGLSIVETGRMICKISSAAGPYRLYPLKYLGSTTGSMLSDPTESCIGTDAVVGGHTLDAQEGMLFILNELAENREKYFVTGNLEAVFLRGPSPVDQISIVDKVKDRSLHSDMMIVTMDGTELPCHKHFIAGHSPVLAKMLADGLEGSSNAGSIKMAEMPSEVAIAFLDFLYEREVKKPAENIKIAFQLLQAGKKYDFPELEKEMKNIILCKEYAWFDIETAGHLFLYSRNVEGYQDLKRKTAQVIRSKYNGIAASQVCEIICQDPLLMVELFDSCNN